MSRNKKEICTAPKRGGLKQFGDSHMQGLRYSQQLPPSHCSRHQAGRGCPQVLGERQLGKDNSGLPEDLVATLSIMLTITEPPNSLAQAAKAFSVVSGGSVFPKQHISIGRAGVFNYPHSERGRKTS